MKKIKFKDWLIKNSACGDAILWVGDRTEAQAWEQCRRADWMIWYLGKKLGTPGYPDINQIVLLACWCARRSLRFVPDGNDLPRLAIEAAEKCAKNNTEENRSAAELAARSAVELAARSAAELAARSAAWSARSAAWSAWSAAWSAWSAAGSAAELAARSAAWSAWSAARSVEHKIMSDYIRKTVKLQFGRGK